MPSATPLLDKPLERLDQVRKRLKGAEARLRAVDAELSDPEVARDPNRLRVLSRRRAEVEPVARTSREIEATLKELDAARELVDDPDDPEVRELARMEVEELERRLERLARRAWELVLPRDPMDDRAAVVEVRAGTGGDEAGLFAAEVMRMYERLAERRGWSVELLGLSEGIPGAVKEAVFTVSGRGAYGALRYESGVHRVQRVPATESQGRIHTSAASVAVLPEAEPVDVEIDPNDLRIDVFRSSGPGGQSVNTTDSAVRITHEPTGLVVTCQDEKSQHKNKAKALKVLRSRLLDREIAERAAERSRERKSQIGSGDRSAKIRTYNFPQNRVTDHRIGLSLHRLESVLQGELDELLEALRLAGRRELMEDG